MEGSVSSEVENMKISRMVQQGRMKDVLADTATEDSKEQKQFKSSSAKAKEQGGWQQLTFGVYDWLKVAGDSEIEQ